MIEVIPILFYLTFDSQAQNTCVRKQKSISLQVEWCLNTNTVKTGRQEHASTQDAPTFSSISWHLKSLKNQKLSYIVILVHII